MIKGMKNVKRLICVGVSLIMLLLAFNQSSIPVRASELTNDSIKAKEKEIEAAQKEKKALQAGLTDVKSLKKQLEQAKADLNSYVEELDKNLDDIQSKIDDLSGQIDAKLKQIDEKQIELDEAIETQKSQYEAMKKRIKFMYEKGDALYLDLVLTSNGFSDALNKAEYIEHLSTYDRKKLDEYVAYSEYVSVCKQEMEAEKEVLEEAKASQEKEQEAMNELLKEKEAEIYKVNSDISAKSAAIAEYEASIAAENETIRALEAAVAEERKRLAEQYNRKYDGGKFCNPCPSVKRISDEYGYRIHPILGTKQFHNGIDMAAPGGSPILAAYSGTVVAATYSSTMGNYIMIDHGDSLYTIYMHASALYVSKGQEVSRGEKIAAVGTTGRSTGNHLHFSVRLNGEYQSPWNYISR